MAEIDGRSRGTVPHCGKSPLSEIVSGADGFDWFFDRVECGNTSTPRCPVDVWMGTVQLVPWMLSMLAGPPTRVVGA